MAFSSPAQTSPQPEVLQRIQSVAPHPRLFWTTNLDAAVKSKIQEDPLLKAAWGAVRLRADHILAEAPVVYRKDGRRLLGRSREALGRMTHLGFAYRITGDSRYFERAVREMEAMAAMQDWNPPHYLDTAEMTLAMAIGYDWFFNGLSDAQKAVARRAIEEKGLGPYLKPGSKHGWEKGGNNWNQVCHAGMVAGALALAEEDPDRAAKIVGRALAGLPYGMKVYDPDGNYPEGPGYWNYGTTFNVMVIDMLKSALGTDFGMSQSPGFMKTGLFPLHTMGPTLAAFNFSDCGSGASFSPAVPWFAAQTKNPDLMWFERDLLDKGIRRVVETKGRLEIERLFPLALVWAQPGMAEKAPSELGWMARGQNPIATFRTSWTDPNAVYLAVKAGTPGANHGHMDIGSFVLDAKGVRWSLDLGAQDYNGLEQRGIGLWNNKQGSQRWSVFRYHNRAHSTLLVNDAEQVVTSKAALSEFFCNFQEGASNPAARKAGVLVDLSEAYAGQLAKATRKFTMTQDGHVVIEDVLTAGDSPARVRWGMTTPAELKPDGNNAAWLVNKSKRLRMEVVTEVDVTLKAWPADPPPRDYDAPNPGVSVVGFERDLKPGEKSKLKVTLY